jgi:DNA invertase Pin-like site-specific DNA recombinase
MAPRALLYLRQSDTSGAGTDSLSLESQAAILRADADRLGWTIVAEIRDADERGWDDQRPGLRELYDRCRAGGIDLVAFWKLDRLARSVRIQEAVVHALTGYGVELYSHHEPWVAQPLFRQILGAVAEQQTRDLSAHVRRTLHQKQRDGHHHGNVPFGYTRPDPRAPLQVDPEPASVVRAIVDMRLHGHGPAEIARELTRRGVLTPAGLPVWRTATISALLRRPTYRGAVCGPHGCTEDAHEAIIPASLWSWVQEQHERHAPRRKVISSWLEGHIVHGCELPMYLIQSHAGRQPYMRCRAAHAGILHALQRPCAVLPRRIVLAEAERLAWQAITAALSSLLDPDDVLAEARRQYALAMPAGEAARREAAGRQSRAAERRERFLGLYGDGVIDRARLDREIAHCAAVERETEAVLARVPEPPDAERIAAQWHELRALDAMLARIAPEHRGSVLARLGTIVVGDGGVRLRLRPELAALVAADLIAT